MKYPTQKLLFLLSQNCRLSYKQLGSELNQSVQTTAYQVQKLESEGIIEYKTIIDYITLGYINVLVGFKVKHFSKENRQKAYLLLKKASYILQVYQGDTAYDFIAEIQAKNLSQFNKMHTDFMQHNADLLKTLFVSPIIVKHTYPRNYLVRKNISEDIITLGNRDVLDLDESEFSVLEILQKKPKSSLIYISEETKISIKKVVAIKKRLESKKIIRKYSCTLYIKALSKDEHEQLVTEAITKGLESDVVHSYMHMLVEEAKKGLLEEELSFLKPLEEQLVTRRTFSNEIQDFARLTGEYVHGKISEQGARAVRQYVAQTFLERLE